MNKKIRQLQLDILKKFSEKRKTFALAGGTALDLYYFHHRFSQDLDFFSPGYDKNEIRVLVKEFEKIIGSKLILEDERISSKNAKAHLYFSENKKEKLNIKIDFIEDIFFNKPKINTFKKVPVYDVEHIYFQKIMAVTGTSMTRDSIGREKITGRNAEKDIVDIFYLSKETIPLHKYIKKLPGEQQRGMIQWYRSYSRQELRINVLDLDIYDKKFDSSIMIQYLDEEIKKYMKEIIS